MGWPTLVYPLEVTGGEETAREIGKDGLTVKKLIALFLVVAFVCASTVGCGETKPTATGAPPKAGGADTGKTPPK